MATEQGTVRAPREVNRVRVSTAAAVLAIIVLSGWGLRVGWALRCSTQPVAGDSYAYANLAENLAGGRGYVANHYNLILEQPDEPKPTAFFPPAYPAVIAGVWKVFGVSTTSIKLLNALLGAATIPFVYAIGRKLFGRAAGLSAATLFAVLPSAVLWTPAFLSEHLFTLLFAGALWALICLPRGSIAVVAFSAVLALAVLTRGQGIVLLPAAALFWLQRDGWSSGIKSTGLALVFAMFLIAPWTARNWIVMDAFIPISSNAGMDVRVGHSPAANGTFEFFAEPLDGVNSWDASNRPDWEVRAYRVYAQRALGYAVSHPQREMVLAKEKVWYLYRPEFVTMSPVLSMGGERVWRQPLDDVIGRTIDASWCAVLFAGLGSLALQLRRSAEHALLASLLVFWTLFHAVFFGLPRFHLPLVPLLAVAAGGGVWQVFETARRAFVLWRQRPRAVATAA